MSKTDWPVFSGVWISPLLIGTRAHDVAVLLPRLRRLPTPALALALASPRSIGASWERQDRSWQVFDAPGVNIGTRSKRRSYRGR